MVGKAPVCHVSTDQIVFDQPDRVRMPSIPDAPTDLASALAAINALRLLVQLLSGQQSIAGPRGISGFVGARGGGGAVGSPGGQGPKGAKGKDGKTPRFEEDQSQRVSKKKKVYQNNDNTSENWVEIDQINKVVWVDNVTGQTLVWSR